MGSSKDLRRTILKEPDVYSRHFSASRLLSGTEPFRSRQQLLNDLSADVGEPEIAALKFEGELRVIKA